MGWIKRGRKSVHCRQMHGRTIEYMNQQVHALRYADERRKVNLLTGKHQRKDRYHDTDVRQLALFPISG